MSGPFKVKWKDYFGFEHEGVFWAQGPKDAIRAVEDEFEYPYEIISVELDIQQILYGNFGGA